MRTLAVLVLFLISLKVASASLIFNEIMYNPVGSDDDHEWLEIYNNGSQTTDLSGWKFYEASTHHSLILKNGTTALLPGDYAIIAEDWQSFLLDYPSFDGTLFDSAFSLSNTGETLILKNATGGGIIANITYNDHGQEGHSLEFFNGTWYKSNLIGGTPGENNSVADTSYTISYNCNATVIINELMYDPFGDECFEYIELYNYANTSTDIGNLVFEGISLTFPPDTIMGPNSYLVIASDLNQPGLNDDFNDRYPDINASFQYLGSLNNNGETILLKCQTNKIVDVVTYRATEDWGGSDTNGLGSSLERILYSKDSYDPNNWDASITEFGTPNANNSQTLIYNDTIVENQCDFNVNILLNQSFFENKDDVKWKIIITRLLGEEKTNITLNRYVEDIAGNLVKSYSPLSIQNIVTRRTLSYSPSLKIGSAYKIVSSFENLTCNDINSSNNINSKIIAIKGPNLTHESFVNIEKIYDLGSDNIAKFGQIIKIRLNAYRGNTTKKTIKLWIEDDSDVKVTKQTSVNINTNYINSTLTVPLQIKPNCERNYEDGNYTIYTEGLDKTDTYSLLIEDTTDSLCETIKVESSTRSSSFTFDIISFPTKANVGELITTKIRITNTDGKKHSATLWSYVYRGSKSYSGDREDNKIEVDIPNDGFIDVELHKIVDEAESGDYKFKLKLIKDEQKTIKELTKTLELINEPIKEKEIQEETILSKETPVNEYASADILFDGRKPDILLSSKKKPILIYESSSVKTKNLILPIILLASILLNIIYIIKD